MRKGRNRRKIKEIRKRKKMKERRDRKKVKEREAKREEEMIYSDGISRQKYVSIGSAETVRPDTLAASVQRH